MSSTESDESEGNWTDRCGGGTIANDVSLKRQACEAREHAADAIENLCTITSTYSGNPIQIVQKALSLHEYKNLRNKVNVKTKDVFDKLDYVTSAPLVAIFFKSLAIQTASQSQHPAVDSLKTMFMSLADEVREMFERVHTTMGSIRISVIDISDNISKALARVRNVLVAKEDDERWTAVSGLRRVRLQILNASKCCAEEAESINSTLVERKQKIDNLMNSVIDCCASEKKKSIELQKQMAILKNESKDYEKRVGAIDERIKSAIIALHRLLDVIEKTQRQLDQKQEERAKLHREANEFEKREGKMRWKKLHSSGETVEAKRNRKELLRQQISHLWAELVDEERKMELLRTNQRKSPTMVQTAHAKMKHLADEIENKEVEYTTVEIQLQEAGSDETERARRASEERDDHYRRLDEKLIKEADVLQIQITEQQGLLELVLSENEQAQNEKRQVKEASIDKAILIMIHEEESNQEVALIAFAQRAVDQLGHFASEWVHVKDFFHKVALLIQVQFQNDAKAFENDYEGVRYSTTSANDAEAVKLKEKVNELIRTTLQLELMINDVVTMCDVYMEVSEKYVTPVLNNLRRYFAFTPEQAKTAGREIESEEKCARKELRKIVENGKKTRDPSFHF